jgi:hypothetical protein
LSVFKPGAVHPVTPAPIKALPCLWIFPPMAEKSKPPAPRVAGSPEHYYGKRLKPYSMPFCAGEIFADKKGINCFNRQIPLDKQTPAGCTGKKHVYILLLCRYCLKFQQNASYYPHARKTPSNWRRIWNL